MFYELILRIAKIFRNGQQGNFEDEIKKQLKFKNVFGRIKTHDNLIYADVMKLVDVPDSKSGVVHPTCRFDSGHRHFLLFFFVFSGVEPPVLTSRKQYSIVCSAEWPSANKKSHISGSFYLVNARVEPQSICFVGSSASELRLKRFCSCKFMLNFVALLAKNPIIRFNIQQKGEMYADK